MIHSIALSGGCYLALKGMGILTTSPPDGDESSLGRVRKRCAELNNQITRVVGERNWDLFAAVVLDNA